MLRPLRIAVSVVSGLCCLLLIALLIRSFWHTDGISGGCFGRYLVTAGSGHGRFLMLANNVPQGVAVDLTWKMSHQPAVSFPFLTTWFSFSAFTNPLTLSMPQWPLIFISGIASYFVLGLRLIRWRFSLRALLLATTAVAFLLGLIIYATRG